MRAARAKGKAVPFEVDRRYVERARSLNPDVVFIATDDGSPQLVECHLLSGSGQYGPASFSPEQGYWHLPRPEQFKPGMNTDKGASMAAKACLEAVPEKISRVDFDHIVYSAVVEISKSGPLYRAGASFGGRKAQRYDIAVTGTSFYKSSGPDLAAVKFTCLLSPMLEVLAIELKK